LEPVTWTTGFAADSSLSLTPTGRTAQWFSTAKMGIDVENAFGRLPGFKSMARIDREKPAAVVLAQAHSGSTAGAAQPALVTMNVGRGSVVAVLGEGLWQWSLLAPENQDLAGFYDAFWSNLIRWLTMGGDFQPGQQVSLRVSRTTARLGDPVSVDVAFKHAPPGGPRATLQLQTPDGGSRQLALAPLPGRDPRFRAVIDPELAGVHTLTLSTPGMIPEVQEKKFNVHHINEERLETSANPLPLKVLAEHSGGVCFEPHQASDFVEHLRRQRSSMFIPPQLEYVWDRGWILFLLLAWTGSEWIFRRFAGML